MKIDRAQLAELCKRYGVLLRDLPAGIDGPTLLWAIAGNESSFGQDVVPRHEPEYCPQSLWHPHLTPAGEKQILQRPGRYSSDPMQAQLHRAFGCLACCSHTAWQIMAAHAWGYTPVELMNDLEKSAEAVVGFLNREIPARKPQTLVHFAGIWNGIASEQYIADLEKHYAAGLPA